MRNIFLIKLIVILNLIVFPLLVILLQKDQTAYANLASSQVYVTVPNLHVRDSADISSKIIGNVHLGDTLEITQSKNGWDQIKLPNNQTGWVFDSYISPIENVKATVSAFVLNIRENPSLSSNIVGKLNGGTKVTISEEIDGWAKIVSSPNVEGWIYEDYITKDGTNPFQTNTATEKKAVSNIPTDVSQSIVSQLQAAADFNQSSGASLKNKTIVLDPGHGGYDDGTTSIGGTHEKTLTLETAQAVEQKLADAGANVIMTRTNDTYIPLDARTNLSKQYHADAFISFHYNWSNDSTANGLTDFYYRKSKDDTLASDILNEVDKSTSLNNDGTTFDNLYVLRNNPQPSTLIELGFVSNQHDDSVVESSSYRDKVAQGVYLGLLDYFSTNKK